MAAPNPGTWALTYLARGWSVVPIRAGEKRPLVRWETFQHRLPGEEEVRDWYHRWPDACVGIVTGMESGLVVLDIDPRHRGEDSLADLARVHGALPDTIEAITGGGGRHIYFAHPGTVVNSRVGIAPGIDVRADGGLVVAPPSSHPSGGRYRWKASRHPDGTPLAALPAWLLELAHGKPAPRGHPGAYWRGLVRMGVAEGERNATIASLTGHLLWHGIDAQVALELLLCWNRVRCRPPLSDDEVRMTVESIRRTHLRHHAEPDQPPGPGTRRQKLDTT